MFTLFEDELCVLNRFNQRLNSGDVQHRGNKHPYGKDKKADIALPGDPHLRATGRHLPCGIIQCFCHPTQVNAPRL